MRRLAGRGRVQSAGSGRKTTLVTSAEVIGQGGRSVPKQEKSHWRPNSCKCATGQKANIEGSYEEGNLSFSFKVQKIWSSYNLVTREM